MNSSHRMDSKSCATLFLSKLVKEGHSDEATASFKSTFLAHGNLVPYPSSLTEAEIMESFNALTGYGPVKKLVEASLTMMDMAPRILRDMMELDLITRQTDVPMEMDDQATLLEATLQKFGAMKKRMEDLGTANFAMHDLLQGWNRSLDSTEVELEKMLSYIRGKMSKKRHSLLMSNLEEAFGKQDDDVEPSSESESEEEEEVGDITHEEDNEEDFYKHLKLLMNEGVFYLPVATLDDVRILVAYYKHDKLTAKGIKAPRGSPVGASIMFSDDANTNERLFYRHGQYWLNVILHEDFTSTPKFAQSVKPLGLEEFKVSVDDLLAHDDNFKQWYKTKEVWTGAIKYFSEVPSKRVKTV